MNTILDIEAPVLLDHNKATAQQLIEHVMQGKYCTLLGPRFSGKTSIVRYIQHFLVRESTLYCIYVSLSDTDNTSEQSFFTCLAQSIASMVTEIRQGEAEMLLNTELLGSSDFRAFIDNIIAWLGRDLVVICDDLERVPANLLRALLSALRAINMEQSGENVSHSGRLVVVIASALNLANLTVGVTSPFYGITKQLRVGELTEAESRQLIDQMFEASSVAVARRVRNYVFRKAYGNANLIRLLCRRSLEQDTSRPTPQLVTSRRVERIVKRFLRDEAANYPPLKEAVRQIEEDPDLLCCVLLLLKQHSVARRELPLPLSSDPDPLYLTGIVRKCADDSYQLHNDIYRTFLAKHFNVHHASHLLSTAGLWDQAIGILAESVRTGDEASRTELLDVAITAIYSAEDYTRAGDLISRALSTVFKARQVAVWLLTANKETLQCVFSWGLEETTSSSESIISMAVDRLEVQALRDTHPILDRENAFRRWAVPRVRSIISMAVDRLEVQALRDTYPILDRENAFRRWAVPLWVRGGRPIGVLTMVDSWPEDGQATLDTNDARLVSYLNQVARGLQEMNSRNMRSDTLRELSTILSGPLTTTRGLELTLDQIARVIPFDSASIQLLNRNKTGLEIVACIGFPDPEAIRKLAFPLENTYPNVQVLNRKAPVRYGNIRAVFKHLADPKYQMGRVYSWLGVPLIVGEQAIGVITLDSYVADIYTLDHENIAMLIAGLAAVAIQRIQLYDRQQQEQHLIRATAQMISAVHDLDQTWHRILEGAMDLIGAETGNISLVDEPFSIIIDQAQKGFPASFPPVRSIQTGGVQGWVARNRRSAVIYDVKHDSEWKDIYLAGREDTRSELAVPIFRGGSLEVVGIINLESSRTGAFNENDQGLLEDLAVIAGLALNNALHYQELEKERTKLGALYGAARTIAQAGLEIETVLQVILNQAVDVTKAQFGTMQLIENNELVFKAAWPVEERAALQDKIGRMPIHGRGITARAVLQGKAQLVPDVSKDRDFLPGICESGCELAVLLYQDNKPIGVLNVEHSEPFELDDGDCELLEGLADLAVIALQNAEQYTELERVKNTLQASQAVAWLGIFGADWKHTIHQRTFSISNDINGLRQLLRRISPSILFRSITEGIEALERIEETIIDIRSVTHDRLYTDAEDQYNALIDDAVRQHIELSRSRNAQVEVRLDLQCPGIRATISRDQLGIALEKLINNAFKEMPNGGQLSITTRSVDHTIQISIRDTGPGIPKEIRENFLRRPIQKPNGANGTGTGVLIANFIVQVNGGNLTWQPNPDDRGIEIILTLPSIGANQP